MKLKLKRKLKKLFFYDRSFIKMVCFLIILLLVLIFGNTMGYVSASGTGYLLNLTDYEASSDYDSNIYCKWFGGNVSTNSEISYNFFTNDFDYTLYNDNSFDASSIKYYMVMGYSYTTKDYVFLFPDDTIVIPTSPWQYNFTFLTKSNYYYRASVSSYGDGNNLFSLEVDTDGVLPNGTSNTPDALERIDLTSATSVDINGTTWYYSYFGDNSHLPILGNMPYYSFYQSVDYNSYSDTIVGYLTNGSNSDKIKDINYLSDSVILPGFDNMEGGGGGSDDLEGTTENNLYLRACKWFFSIPEWKKLTSYSGNATFSASLNEFQQENLEDFYLTFSFTIHTTQSYVNNSWGSGTSGGGHDTSDVLGTGANYTGYNNYIFKYVDSSTNNDYQKVTLQEFYNMGSSKAFMTLNGIFDRCFKVGFSGNVSDTKFTSWYSDAISSSRYTTTKAILYCYATLYDSSGNSSGNCVYYYDLLNGTSGVTDSSMSVNNNPYVDEDGNVEGEVTTEGTTTDNYNGNGVNVTQTVNVNNDSGDSKSWLWTLISSLITSDDENVSQAGMSDTLVNFVGINPWISLMSTTFGFIPATIWTTLSACFLVVMGILVVAFVLRIILDLL